MITEIGETTDPIPSISVVIPVYNGAHYLDATIDSVLAQTVQPSEIVVVNDGSTDSTIEIAETYAPRVRCLHQANLGQAAARNLGVEAATGSLLAFIDADDLWVPEKLERQCTVLAQYPHYDAMLGKVENFISPDLSDIDRQPLMKAENQGGDYHVGALLIRRGAFQRVGAFDTRWRFGDFVEWWARAIRLDLCYLALPELVLCRRLHADNLTRRKREGRREYLSILREQALQHRASEREL